MIDVSATVLVVEDEALVRLSITEDLRDAGFVVCEARDADDALQKLQLHDQIRVIFTDIQMPGSMDGLRLAATVRNKWPQMGIIVTSGNLKPSPDTFPEGGLFIPKPYASETVTSAIQGIFAQLNLAI